VKAIVVHHFGGPEVLQYDEIPDPEPKAGEALVRIEAAGVNFIDIYQRSGAYKVALPAILGQEGAGTVIALGPNTTGVIVGDTVAWTSVLGSYAEKITVPVDRLVALPAGVSTKQGAAIMLQGMTAHYLATSTYPLDAGNTCLVHAGAGGVGLLLTQIAKMRGTRVITTVSNEAKARLSREAGADHVIDYTSEDFEAAVKRVTSGAGVQVIYDSVGQTTFEKSLNCLARRGMLVLFGQSSGPVPPFDPQVLSQKGSLFLTRPTLVHYTAVREELQRRASDLFNWLKGGRLKLRIEFESALRDAPDAHRALAGRRTMGKVILLP